MAGTALLTSWVEGGGLHSGHDGQPGTGGSDVCGSHAHSSRIWLVSGETSDSWSIPGQEETLDVTQSNETRNRRPLGDMTNSGPHSSWMVEPFWAVDYPNPPTSCFLSIVGPAADAIPATHKKQVGVDSGAWTGAREGDIPPRVTLNLHDL